MNRREGGEQVALIVVVPVNGASYEDNGLWLWPRGLSDWLELT